MYYIDDYKKRAIDKIIPYLVDFPQIVKIIENSADRYQAIEDLLWSVATNFKVADSRGVFLDAHAKNEVLDIIYTDKADDAFTYGTDKPLYQAYGTGHYYSQASYISGIRKNISEDKLIRAVQAKIIQNNTNCTIEDLIEGLKLLYNATGVKIYESNPLTISVMLTGSKIELSSSGNYENIKKMLANCIGLKNIYVNPHQFDIFTYDENASYGENRYPVRVGDAVDLYYYISQSTNLDSEFEEYIVTNHEKFDNNMFCCIAGSFTKINDGAVLFSSVDTVNHNIIKVGIKYSEDGEPHLFSQYNDTEVISDNIVQLNKKYTIVIMNDNNVFKVWLYDGVLINGTSSSTDESKILNRIANIEPNIYISDYFTVEAPITINCEQGTGVQSNFGDFLYYAIIFGNADLQSQNINTTEYYATCFGEKQIIFNCLENKNHLHVNTKNPLLSNIMTKQSYYNYKATHSNGKYLYLDGKSNIEYYVLQENSLCNVTDIDISFDICIPINIQTSPILTNLINDEADNSGFYIEKQDDNYTIMFNCKHYNAEGEIQEIRIPSNITLKTEEFTSIRFTYSDNKFAFYKNGAEISIAEIDGYLHNILKTFIVGSNLDLTSMFKGFIKNLFIKIKGEDNGSICSIDLDLPYKSRLKDSYKKYDYTNFGARFITTPQLINDTKNLDLYGNNLIGSRI